MSVSDLQRDLIEHRSRLYRPSPKQTVVEWAEENITLTRRVTEAPGPFSTALRWYAREPIECWKNTSVSEVNLCWGTQSSKTTVFTVGMAWAIDNDPASALWAMPSEPMARSFVKTRWLPMLEDSENLLAHFPDDRNKITTLEQHFYQMTLTFVGSNSPANLASRSCRYLVADEIEKFRQATTREADALLLALHRLKAFSSSKAFLSSTPTTTDGQIWQRFLSGDQRRYFLPCPHCKQPIKLLWEQVRWNHPETKVEARTADGAWDFDLVRRWSRYQCQLCGGEMSDAHKIVQVRKGEWVSENKVGLPGVRSYHLSSLYAPDKKCTWGSLAIEFLKGKESVGGLQDFVNSYLAEPWENQGAPAQREEIIVTGAEALPDDSLKILTVDYQAREPYFWFVVRAWAKDGSSRAIEAGSLDTWQDVREMQTKHGIQDVHVMVDSGYDAPAVYRECLRWGTFRKRPMKVPLWVGWIPAKGMPRNGWRNPSSNVDEPFFLRGVDPRVGDNAGRQASIELKLLEFATDPVKDVLNSLRRGMTSTRWEVSDSVANPEYWRHLDCEVKTAHFSQQTGRTKWTWLPRSKKWPNHLGDCEAMQIAAAIFHRRLVTKAAEQPDSTNRKEQ